MKRLRIVHLDAGATWRGGQRQALLLALGLRDRGHESFLIGIPNSPLVTKARAAGLAVAAIPMRADWDVRAARRIRSRIRAWSADIVHAHDARSHALAMMALLGRRDIPFVVTRRVPFTPRSARVKYGDRVSVFIAISRAVRDAMISGGVAPARIVVVHSGIPVEQAPLHPRDWRAELGWPTESVVCGVVGAMTAEKGIDYLYLIGRALDPTAHRIARLVLLGGNADQRHETGGISAFAAGFVADIDSAIAGLDALWHPSRAEGLGTSVIDAMALGVPPVAFAVGGLPEIIEHEVSGLLIRPGDTQAFADCASRLLCDPRLRERLSRGARARSQLFSADAMTKGTEEVYYTLVTG